MVFASARKKVTPLALTILRVVVGLVMVAHGWQKAMGFQDWQGSVASLGIPFPDIAAGLSVAAELGGGLGLVLGALTPLAALGIFINMLIAIGYVHLGRGLFAAQGGWEFPLTIAVVALYYVFRGAGPLSVDALVERARKRPERERVEPPPVRRPAETTA